jgi:hypothetical protein
LLGPFRHRNYGLQVASRFATDEIAPPAKTSNSLAIRQPPNIDILAVDANQFVDKLQVERESMGNLVPDSIQELDRWH